MDLVGIAADPNDVARRFTNRELSWLDFNERVLAMAGRRDIPIIERAKFAAIFAANLDEFFQVRVAGLRELAAAGASSAFDNLTPSEQLASIHDRVVDLYAGLSKTFHDELAPGLDEVGIRFSDWASLDDDDREWLVREFHERVFPVLTPLAVDPAHPFPYISNLSLNLAVFVRRPGSRAVQFARVKVPPILPRFVVMPDGERFVPLEQVIAAHLDALFPGMEIVGHHTFRVTRNADLVVEDEEADDLLLAIESELTRQRFGRVVRLEIEPDMDSGTLDLLREELGLTGDEVYTVPGPLDLSGLFALSELNRPDLTFEPFTPVTPPRLASTPSEPKDLFATIRERDVLVQHPYESFHSSVQAFIEQAARDPKVLAIKQTLYRTSGPGSPIVRSLIKAADEGKQVVVLVEIKTRFDEEANIEWARALEEAGVHVVYGLVGLKTHTKTTLVVRDEDGIIRRYAHVGTGNYNDKTARLYEDLGVLTADPEVGADLTDLFNFLTGYSQQRRYRKLVVAPVALRQTMLDLIEAEAEADDGHIVMKMNSLVDAEIIDALYRASQDGTPIDLVVRGICCLRAGVPGLSDNIRVRSIVGRYLEHSRIYRFGSDARGYRYLIGSADMMPRNLDRRVEAILPVDDFALTSRLQEILDVCFEDDTLAWELGPDDLWRRIPTEHGHDTHLRLQYLALERATRGMEP